jgi:hypothetical protein
MNRREAVQTITILTGGMLGASSLSMLLESCNHDFRSGKGTTFTTDEKEIISKMSDIIIPRTHTPGAVDAGVPAFIIMMLQECYPAEAQQQFHTGLGIFDHRCREKYGSHFLKLSKENQQAAVSDTDNTILGEKRGESVDKNLDAFYRNMKALTITGYYSSKPGATEALRYVPVPGRYEGCIPYHRGDKAWAT